jgi:hypothetical protein
MIKHLQTMGDPIVSKFRESELNPIMMENVYHSPEESESDQDSGASEKNCIVIRDIKWRSDCVSIRVNIFRKLYTILIR